MFGDDTLAGAESRAEPPEPEYEELQDALNDAMNEIDRLRAIIQNGSCKMVKRFNSSAEALVYIAECQVATFEDSLSYKKYSKADKKRFRNIAIIAVEAVRMHAMEAVSDHTRVKRIIDGEYSLNADN